MANRVSVNTTNNEVKVTPNQNTVTVNTTSGNVTVTKPETEIVTVNNQGPQGVPGNDGPGLSTPFSGSAIITGSLEITGSTSFIGPTSIDGGTAITGSLTVSDSFTSVGPFSQSGESTFNGDTVITGSLSVSGGITGSISPSLELTPIIEYLDTKIERQTSDVSQTSFTDAIGNVTLTEAAIFESAKFATQPSGFPPIEKHDFQYFINGVLIPHSIVHVISELSGARVGVYFNRDLLGYTLESTDVITVIGKFNPSAFSSGFSNGFSRHVYSMVTDLVTLIFNKRDI